MVEDRVVEAGLDDSLSLDLLLQLLHVVAITTGVDSKLSRELNPYLLLRLEKWLELLSGLLPLFLCIQIDNAVLVDGKIVVVVHDPRSLQ